MTKLDAVIETLRALPEAEQERLAMEIAQLIHAGHGDSALSDEEWAAIEAGLREDDALIPHDIVKAELRAKFPG